MITRQTFLYLTLAALVILPACSSDQTPQGIHAGVRPGESTVQVFPGQDTISVIGRIRFERLRVIADPAGLSPTTTRDIAPARFVDVIALDAATGAEIQTAAVATAADGTFTLPVTRGIPFRIVVLASTLNSGGRANFQMRDQFTTERIAVSLNNASGGGVFNFDPRFGKAEIDLPTISLLPQSSPPAAGNRPAGAFCILDSLVTASEEVRLSTGTAPSLCTVFWSPDSGLGSFFDPVNAPFGPSLFIKGGDLFFDDVDDFDQSVIAHEFGHFVSFTLLRDSSLGGAHGGGDVLYPSLAYSEGFANAFSGMVLKQASYVDAAFLTSPFVDFLNLNLENRANSTGFIGNQVGIGSEISVGEILWDIVDGTTGRTDTDSDGVATEFAAYFRQEPRPGVTRLTDRGWAKSAPGRLSTVVLAERRGTLASGGMSWRADQCG